MIYKTDKDLARLFELHDGFPMDSIGEPDVDKLLRHLKQHPVTLLRTADELPYGVVGDYLSWVMHQTAPVIGSLDYNQRMVLHKLLNECSNYATREELDFCIRNLSTEEVAALSIIKNNSRYQESQHRAGYSFGTKRTPDLLDDSFHDIIAYATSKQELLGTSQVSALVLEAHRRGGFSEHSDAYSQQWGPEHWLQIARSIEGVYTEEQLNNTGDLYDSLTQFMGNEAWAAEQYLEIVESSPIGWGLGDLSVENLGNLLRVVPIEKVKTIIQGANYTLRPEVVDELLGKLPKDRDTQTLVEFMTTLDQYENGIPPYLLEKHATPADWEDPALVSYVKEAVYNGQFDPDNVALLDIVPVSLFEKHEDLLVGVLNDISDFSEIPKKLRGNPAIISAFLSQETDEDTFIDVYTAIKKHGGSIPQVINIGKKLMDNGFLAIASPSGMAPEVAALHIQGLNYWSKEAPTDVQGLKQYIRTEILRNLETAPQKRWAPVVKAAISDIKGYRHAASKGLLPIDVQWGLFLAGKKGMSAQEDVAAHARPPMGLAGVSPFKNFNTGTFETICKLYKIPPYGKDGGRQADIQRYLTSPSLLAERSCAYETSAIFRKNTAGAIQFLESTLPPSVVVAETENLDATGKLARNFGISIKATTRDPHKLEAKRGQPLLIVWDGKAKLPDVASKAWRVVKVDTVAEGGTGSIETVSIKPIVRKKMHDLTMTMRVGDTPVSAAWGQFLVKYPEAAVDASSFFEVEQKFGVPNTLVELRKQVAIIGYGDISTDKATQTVAGLCAKLEVSKSDFEQVLALSKRAKHTQELPAVSISKDELTLNQIPARDARALVIGVESGCCQSVGGVGEDSAIHSYAEPSSCVYVVEKAGECIAQSWVWLSTDGKHAVIDSIESKFDNKATVKQVAEMYLGLCSELRNHGISVMLSDTSYGMSEAVRKALNLNASDLEETPVMKVICDYSDATVESYSMDRVLQLKLKSEPKVTTTQKEGFHTSELSR